MVVGAIVVGLIVALLLSIPAGAYIGRTRIGLRIGDGMDNGGLVFLALCGVLVLAIALGWRI